MIPAGLGGIVDQGIKPSLPWQEVPRSISSQLKDFARLQTENPPQSSPVSAAAQCLLSLFKTFSDCAAKTRTTRLMLERVHLRTTTMQLQKTMSTRTRRQCTRRTSTTQPTSWSRWRLGPYTRRQQSAAAPQERERKENKPRNVNPHLILMVSYLHSIKI